MSGVDRISYLPDEIIHHILSFLPTTKLRARTSLLSKQWRNIWTHHPSLQLSVTYNGDNVASIDYVRAILGCLQSCNAAVLHQVSVDLFLPTLCSPDEVKLHAKASDMLLRFVGLHFVRELRVQTLSDPSSDSEVDPTIPGSLFCCDSVVDLIVLSGTFPNVPRDFHGFRFLNSLYLSYGSIDNDTLRDLLVCCPILESLSVVGCTGPTDIDVSPWNLPELTDLTLFACEDLIGARIEAPSLRSITYEGDLQCLHLKSSPVLLEAAIRNEVGTDFDTQDDLIRLLLAISSVNVLTANDWFYQLVIPKPAMLKSLKELTLYIDDGLSEAMLNTLITNMGECPMLEKLYINLSYVPRENLRFDDSPPVLYSYAYFQQIFKHLEENHEQDEYDPSELLGEPRCSLWNLKTIVLGEFLGSKKEMRMVKFLLGSAVALEEFVVFDFLERDEDELQELFAPIPKASPQVHLKLSELEKSTVKDCFGKHASMFIW